MTKKYLSGRNKVKPFSGLSTDRHKYLHLDEAEPNLGYPGEKSVIGLAGTYYKLITLDSNNLYDRYWIAESPQNYLNGLSVFDEDVALIAGINSVSKLNFRGAQAAMQSAKQQMAGTRITAPASGPLDNDSSQQSYTPDAIRDMTMADYAKQRAKLLGTAASNRGQGLFDQ